MFEDHFGLRPRPFGPSPGGAGLVRLPSREATASRLRFALEHGGGPALLVGPSGVGKTLLARAVGSDLGGPVVHLTFPALPPADLLALLADELAPRPGDAETAPSWSAAIRRLRLGLMLAATRDERPLLIVDDAHLIADPATWDALRLMLNFASAGPPDLVVLVLGSPEVLGTLPTAFADRLTARATLRALTLTETASYVLGRLQIAGADRPLFDPPALARLHQAAEGIPRRIDHLADLALLVAAAEGGAGVVESDVQVAVADSPPDLLAA